MDAHTFPWGNADKDVWLEEIVLNAYGSVMRAKGVPTEFLVGRIKQLEDASQIIELINQESEFENSFGLDPDERKAVKKVIEDARRLARQLGTNPSPA